MKADLEMSLIHDGVQWVARDQTLEVRGKTLLELDQALAQCLRERGDFRLASQINVFMGFDYAMMPAWMRQYAYHYFNRYAVLQL